jgi:hypothetical protein
MTTGQAEWWAHSFETEPINRPTNPPMPSRADNEESGLARFIHQPARGPALSHDPLDFDSSKLVREPPDRGSENLIRFLFVLGVRIKHGDSHAPVCNRGNVPDTYQP